MGNFFISTLDKVSSQNGAFKKPVMTYTERHIISVTRLGDLLDFGQFLKPLATINLPKSPTFLGNFCKGVRIYHFSSEIMFGQLLQTFGDFFWSHW